MEVLEELLGTLGTYFEKEIYIEVFGSIACIVHLGEVEEVKPESNDNHQAIGVWLKGDEGEITIYFEDVLELFFEDDLANEIEQAEGTEFLMRLVMKNGLELYFQEFVD